MTRSSRIVTTACLAGGLLAGTLHAQEIKLRPMRPVYVDSLGAGIQAPEGVDFDGSSRLIVADTGNRRFVLFNVSQDSISPSLEFRLGQVAVPVHVRFDSAGDILALDGKSHRIARIGADGSFKGYLEIAPADGQRSAFVKSFEVDADDNLFVLETFGSRILIYDGAGNLRRSIAYASEVRFLSDLTVGVAGVVFAIDSVGRRVFVARKEDDALTPLTESMGEDMAFPTAIAADGMGYLYISDQTGNGIVVLGENGSFHGRHSSRGRSPGFLWQPAGLYADDDYLFLADRGNHRVQVFAITR